MTSNKLFLILLFASFLSPGVSLGSSFSEIPFDDSEHCVAYKTKKRLFLITSVDVLGKNCDISSQVIPEPGELYHVEVLVPILSFESGEVERDRDVAKLLKVEKQKEMNFTSESLTQEQWTENLNKKDFDLKGTLSIAGKSYPVVAKIHLEDNEEKSMTVQGMISARFKDFDLKPPKLWGGIGATVSKDLKLLFQLQPEKTLGSSFLLKN